MVPQPTRHDESELAEAIRFGARRRSEQAFGEYYQGDFGAAFNGATGAARTFGGSAITGSDVDVWGLAAVQSIDAAALDLYISFRQYSADIYTVASPNGAPGVDEFKTVFSGAKISF